MTIIDSTATELAALFAEYHDRRDGIAETAPSVTVEVTYTRERLLLADPSGVEVWTLTTSFGNARGLVWIEDGERSRIIASSDLRTEYPQVAPFDRREFDRA